MCKQYDRQVPIGAAASYINGTSSPSILHQSFGVATRATLHFVVDSNLLILLFHIPPIKTLNKTVLFIYGRL